ncbi:MAG TPA: AbrB/MazE/SpoVT family DNA-binding domain-containing protein, partial [Rhodothermales bacterium]|nr:AbrB/MazE/SpoVT family DNA-binding domain-containing protein [Rhodothermales bacterium]
MTKPLKIRRVGNSLGVILPKGVLDSLHLQEGSTVTITRTPDGLLLMPLDSDHEETMAAYEVVARTYKNALRELAK